MIPEASDPVVYVLNGGSRFPLGVFSSYPAAEAAISGNRISGLLTEYPLDVLPYALGVEIGIIKITKPWQTTAKYIQNFSNVGKLHDHWHFEDSRTLKRPPESLGPSLASDQRKAVKISTVYIFNGAGGGLPAGAFTSITTAQAAISCYGLSGILTAYPMDAIALDCNLENSGDGTRIDWEEEAELAMQAIAASGTCECQCYENGGAVQQ